ncbi:MAG TPA: NAD(P)-binding domain-containing protein [Gemmatimonadales bacterium]|nr:NAD(P)-binding domain-containing protein [Gemmatimonadales bacterium]
MRKRLDAIIVGGGQAGLALGRELALRGKDFLILEAGRRIGDAWRHRWDSLTLFTPARYSALPGLAFPAEPDHHPTAREMAAYLESYARAFELPVALDEPVRELRRADGSRFIVTTDHARYIARQVVVATGPFQAPALPAAAALLPPGVRQLHSSEYRNSAELEAGPVLVVGGGNSGVQIAAEVARSHETMLAVGTRLRRLPRRLFGRSVFEWLDRVGAMSIPVESALGRRASRTDVLIGDSPRSIARRLGVRLLERVVGVCGSALALAGGTTVAPRTVIWATGFRPDYPWLRVPTLDARGLPEHRQGVSQVAGLYFLGLPWLRSRGSALVGWVGRDAAYLAGQMETQLARAA